jgi:hypothetical protein
MDDDWWKKARVVSVDMSFVLLLFMFYLYY